MAFRSTVSRELGANHCHGTENAVTRAVKLVNEISLNFLRGPYFDYMVANFGEPAE